MDALVFAHVVPSMGIGESTTACRSTIALRNLRIETQIGTYRPGDVVPQAHVLDLTLAIDPDFVLIEDDSMAHIFDYEPLILEIDRLARDCHYATQDPQHAGRSRPSSE